MYHLAPKVLAITVTGHKFPRFSRNRVATRRSSLYSQLQISNMPPIRTPLGQISGNSRPKGHELTPIQRAKIVGAAEYGVSLAQIAAQSSLPDSTICYTIQQDTERSEC